MDARAAELIAVLQLLPHPEGGYYRETHRSALQVTPADSRGPRAALTTIHFLLPAGEISRWHRVGSDEVWHFLDGAVLELHQADSEFEAIHTFALGPYGEAAQPTRVVPAGCWQAAHSTGAYTLVGCTVGPGFEFADFELLRDCPRERSIQESRHPRFTTFL